jgi:hypothetical protein
MRATSTIEARDQAKQFRVRANMCSNSQQHVVLVKPEQQQQQWRAQLPSNTVYQSDAAVRCIWHRVSS